MNQRAIIKKIVSHAIFTKDIRFSLVTEIIDIIIPRFSRKGREAFSHTLDVPLNPPLQKVDLEE